MIDRAPIIEASVGGVTTSFLIDTGSQVSTITETFYRTHLAQTENHLQDPNNWLTIGAANGLTVPFVGYLELDIEVCGIVVPKARCVCRDERKGDVCGLLGTNVFMSRAMDFTMLEPSSDGRENFLVITDVFSRARN